MAHTVTYTNEAFPDDHEFEIRGLGVLVNGVPTVIDKDAEQRFILETRTTLDEALADNGSVNLSGTTEFSGGVVEVLGVDPDEISDAPELVVVDEPVAVAEQPAPTPLDALLNNNDNKTDDDNEGVV